MKPDWYGVKVIFDSDRETRIGYRLMDLRTGQEKHGIIVDEQHAIFVAQSASEFAMSLAELRKQREG